jgi:AAA+ superfamily predicted ATPase
MNNNIQKPVTADINRDFNHGIDLYNLIGQKKCRKKLLIQLNQYLVDKAEGKSPAIEPILFVGRTATTVARAYSNSFGNSQFFEVEASCLGMGMGTSDFFQRGNEFTTYFLRRVEHLSNWYVNSIVELVQNRELHTPCIPGFKEAEVLDFNRLMIFSAQDISSLNVGILNSIDIVCHLQNYSASEILEILKQRIRILGWNIQNTEMLRSITAVSANDVDRAIRMLHWTYRSARASGSDTLETKHLNNALHLMQ